MTFYLIVIVMFDLCVTLCEIITYSLPKLSIRICDLQSAGQVHKLNIAEYDVGWFFVACKTVKKMTDLSQTGFLLYTEAYTRTHGCTHAYTRKHMHRYSDCSKRANVTRCIT